MILVQENHSTIFCVFKDSSNRKMKVTDEKTKRELSEKCVDCSWWCDVSASRAPELVIHAHEFLMTLCFQSRQFERNSDLLICFNLFSSLVSVPGLRTTCPRWGLFSFCRWAVSSLTTKTKTAENFPPTLIQATERVSYEQSKTSGTLKS